MGISAEDDPLYVERIELVKQSASACFVEMDDEAVADHIDNCAQMGIPPARCGRIWMHTHPGSSAEPSMTDEQTFHRAFGGCDWSVMFILARGGAIYARLQFGALAGVQVKIPVTVDWSAWPTIATTLLDPDLTQQWQMRHSQCVRLEPTHITRGMVFDYDALDERAWRVAMAELDGEYDLTGEMIADSESEEVNHVDP